MFVNAIEEIQHFTRPIHTIVKYYHNNFIQPGAATLFFVNELGVAITCKHVLGQLVSEHDFNSKYSSFKDEKKLLGTKIDGKYKKKYKKLKNIDMGLESLISKLDRQFLHAKTLGFIHPKTNEEMIFSSILPQELNNLLKSSFSVYYGKLFL